MGAQMFDAALMEKAGVVRKTKKVNQNTSVVLTASKKRENLLRIFRIMDEQDAVNRYRWFNIPCDLSSQEIERLIYLKGQLVFFYYPELDKFYLMPYALDGGLDFYGRYNRVHPVPLSDGTSEDEKSDRYVNQLAILSMKKLKIAYDVADEEEISLEDLDTTGVLLHDYSKQLAQTIVPRSVLNTCLTELMADIVCYADTAALIGTGIEGYRVDSADAKDEVKTMSQAIYNAAITKTPYVALTNTTEFQELKTGTKYSIEEYLMTFQSIDNLRLSTYGIANGGVYEKKAHILESEVEMNNSNVYSAYQDGLSIRQHFCLIVNSIWGTSMWCEASEDVIKADLDGDGADYDREDGAPEEEGGTSDGTNE